jgi:translocator protein
MSEKLKLAYAIGASALPFVGSILASSGYDSGKAITEWYDKLNAPKLKPPNWVFAPVWSYLYTSSGYASYLVWSSGGGFSGLAQGPLLLYGATLIFNWAFSPIYFGRRDVKMVSLPVLVNNYVNDH